MKKITLISSFIWFLRFHEAQSEIEPTKFSNDSSLIIIDDQVQGFIRPISATLPLQIMHKKIVGIFDDFSKADCNGETSCELQTYDKDEVSKGLRLQANLDRFEPLYLSQFLGTHNSAISRRYTHSQGDFNLNLADPNQFLSIPRLLDQGVRQIELDIIWDNNLKQIKICHNHFSDKLNWLLCDNNFELPYALAQIRSWIDSFKQKNPNEALMLIIYMDINQPLPQDVISILDNDFGVLSPYIYLKNESKANMLDTQSLSKHSLNSQNKHIIITADSDKAISSINASNVVFTKIENANKTPLVHLDVSSFLNSGTSCNSSLKYNKIISAFGDSIFNLFRVQEDRTLFGRLSDKPSGDNFSTSVITNYNIPKILDCPINIIGMDLLGFTCGLKGCSFSQDVNLNEDPRFKFMLWSWALGYPKERVSQDLAYIDPVDLRFKNDKINLMVGSLYYILCAKKEDSIKLTWSIVANRYYGYLKESCSDFSISQIFSSNKVSFAAPVTSFWMKDVQDLIKKEEITQPVFINLRRNAQEGWVANDGRSLVA